MKILILGGTGLIGSAVTRRLVQSGADVSVLCRSISSYEKAQDMGAMAVTGDICNPSDWYKTVDDSNAVIHLACTFESNMVEIDASLSRFLITQLANSPEKKTLIYTGGTWLFADSGGAPITENTVYSPLPDFAWMVSSARMIQQNTSVRGMTIHPAVVVDDPDGIPDLLIEDFNRSGQVVIPFSRDLHWPIVSTEDLAEAYYLVLENGIAGESYHAASIESACVADLAKLLARRHGITAKLAVKPLEYWSNNYGEISQGRLLNQSLVSEKLRSSLGWKPGLTLK